MLEAKVGEEDMLSRHIAVQASLLKLLTSASEPGPPETKAQNGAGPHAWT